MKITKKVVAAGTAGLLTAGGIGMLVLSAPVASAASTTAESGSTSRLQAIKDALAGLVGDGSITQAQADEVATTLESSDALRGRGGHGGGPGGRGFGLEAAAGALGLTQDELRTALQAEGATLASVAEAEGVDEQVLVDALVAAGEERLEQAVTDGRLTRAQADERIAALPAEVAERIDQELRGGRGGGPRGGGEAPAAGGTATQESSSTT